MNKSSVSKSKKHLTTNEEKPESNRFIKAVHKNEGQQIALKAIDENKVTILTGCAGTGKAQPLTAKVYTPNGFKFMSEIEVGDIVCTPDGGTACVTGVFPQGVKDMYRIHFADGATVDACPEHLWKVEKLGSPHVKSRVVTTQFLRENLTYLNGRIKWAIACPKPLKMDEREVSIDPYMMGVLLGDGGLTEAVRLSSEDDEILVAVKSNLDDGYELKHDAGCNYRIAKIIRGGGSVYYDALRSYGLLGKNSEEKHIPCDYLYNSADNRLAILQGLMDTDGEADKNGACAFTTTSTQLAEGVKWLVQSLGGVCFETHRKPTFVYKGEKKGGRLAYKLSIQFPNHKDLFRLSRKTNATKMAGRCGTKRKIVRIEEIERVPAQCIMLDSDDHLYITDHGVVTHNTYLAVSYALQMLFRQNYKKVIFTRPVVEAGESLGFLPGDFEEKISPYMIPIMDIMGDHLSVTDIETLYDEHKIVVLPLAYMRGVTFKNSIVILDEAQNATAKQLHMFLTRLGDGAKVILTGDPSQSDIGVHSGLKDAIVRLQGVAGLEIVHLDENCVVRDPIVAEINQRYENRGE